jgi:serine phosphatase RsbU (regulator of sigma subunit)
MSARLRVQPYGLPGFERELDPPELVVGRAVTAGLTLSDASVSRRHMRFAHREGRWWAEDLGARHGTILNDAPLVAPTPLGAGDRIQIGETVILFEPGVADVPTARPGELSTAVAAAALDLDRQAARLRTLNEIHRALATPISLTALLDLILERCFDVLKPQEGIIVLRQPDGSFATAATRRLPGSTGEVLVSRSLIEEVVGRGKPALVIDAAIDERFGHSDSIIASGVKSVVAAPLSDADGSIGMIALLSRARVKMFAEQDLDMLGSLASAAALRVRNIALAEQAAARKVLERELALAHDIQMAMLPRSLPDRPEIDLAASVTPARSVGGDLYDFVVHGDRLWFVIADVSGKGVPAALYMAVAKTLFRATVHLSADLSQVLSRMNVELARENDQAVFVTGIVGHVSLSTGEVLVGDAGHNPAFIRRRDGTLETADMPKNLALGVLEDVPYDCGRIVLGVGDTLILYTDGVVDARAQDGEMFGSERLEQAILSSAPGADAIAAAITGATARFSAGAPPEDDLTLLVLGYCGAAPCRT